MIVLLVVLYLVVVAAKPQPQTRWLEEEDTPQLSDAVVGDYATVRLSLSLWDPQSLSGQELAEVIADPILQNNVVRSLQQVLCSVSDTRIVSRAAALFDESLLDDYDVCVQTYGRPRKSGLGRRVTVLQTQPEIETVQVTRLGVVWSLWSVSWTTLRVGDLYVSEAIMNNPYVPITDVEELAVRAMENVAQLSLNINIMEDDFDDLLRTNLRSRRLYASVTSDEIETFAAAAIDYKERFTYSPRLWYPLRLWGFTMLLSLFSIVTLLMLAASCRRRRLEHLAKHSSPREVLNLGSAEYVDNLLLHSPSSNFQPKLGSTSIEGGGNGLCEPCDDSPSVVSSLGTPYGDVQADPSDERPKTWVNSCGFPLVYT